MNHRHREENIKRDIKREKVSEERESWMKEERRRESS